MKKFYQKYKDWVVIGLLGLFLFKSCQSCSRSRFIDFNEKKHLAVVDSLCNHINILDDSIDDLHSDEQLYIKEIQSLNQLIEQYKTTNRSLMDDNSHYRNANRVLVNTNNQIINKDN